MKMQCCFVNTEQKPVKIRRMGMYAYSKHENDILVSEWCEVFYPHPDAPEDALVSIYRPLPVTHPVGSDKLIVFAINAVMALDSICNLQHDSELVEQRR